MLYHKSFIYQSNEEILLVQFEFVASQLISGLIITDVAISKHDVFCI